MREIEIKVFRFVVGKEKVVFCRQVNLDDEHIFPFAMIKSALEVLFGKDYYISFTICPDEK